MIEYNVLRKLVFQVLRNNPRANFTAIIPKVGELAASADIFPTEEDCRKKGADYSYYKQRRLNPNDELNVSQIIWDLIVDRVLTMGSDRANPEWPWLRLTEFGNAVLSSEMPTHYEPEGYLASLESFAPKFDPVIKQYTLEGLNSYRRRLFFASAVMFGAAAEKVILLLLQSIGNAESDPRRKLEIEELLERPRLPSIFAVIQSTLTRLIKAKSIPFSTHQGSIEHLLSLFEMIRVQRNDAVHPAAAQVESVQVYLTIQAFPAALGSTYRLIAWFEKNKI